MGHAVGDGDHNGLVHLVRNHQADSGLAGRSSVFHLLKRTYKLKAHDENNQCGVGDRVKVMETRPQRGIQLVGGVLKAEIKQVLFQVHQLGLKRNKEVSAA